jgi:hypothetical protein
MLTAFEGGGFCPVLDDISLRYLEYQKSSNLSFKVEKPKVWRELERERG